MSLKVTAILKNSKGKECKVNIESDDNGVLYIEPEGYGDFYSNDGDGTPIMIEFDTKGIRIVAWADINQQEPTHTIDMRNALETNREAANEDGNRVASG